MQLISSVFEKKNAAPTVMFDFQFPWKQTSSQIYYTSVSSSSSSCQLVSEEAVADDLRWFQKEEVASCSTVV